MYMDMAAVLSYAVEVSGVLAFLLALPGAWASARTWTRQHRHRGYRPRHARRGASCAAAGATVCGSDRRGRSLRILLSTDEGELLAGPELPDTNGGHLGGAA